MDQLRAVSLVPREKDIQTFAIMCQGIEIGAAMTSPMLFPVWEVKLFGTVGPSKRPVEFTGRGDTNGNAIIDAIQRAERDCNERFISVACIKQALAAAGVEVP